MTDQNTQNVAAILDAAPQTYESAVRVLAIAHASSEISVRIYYVSDPDKRVVRLIEVSEAFPEGAVERPAPAGGIERVIPIFPLGPAKDFPFRSEVAQITGGEWEQLRQGKLKLNRDWGDLKNAKRVDDGE
ncbi:MAG TPA: hypothetical protein VG326_17875 [Tepidisphaeraceae bacterium]|jgi:hypothetical protein|nr:hypothetical protein [Tepidisphaeraceae bacterium]